MAVQALQAKLPVSIPPTAPAPPGSPKLRSFGSERSFVTAVVTSAVLRACRAARPRARRSALHAWRRDVLGTALVVLPQSCLAAPNTVRTAPDVARSLWGKGLRSDEDLARWEAAVASDCVYEDLYYAEPAKGKQAVVELIRQKLLPPKSHLVIDSLSDGSSSCGFTWHIEEDGVGIGHRGLCFVRLNSAGEVAYVRDLGEPLFKAGELTEKLLEALTKDQPLPERPVLSGPPQTPRMAGSIVKYLYGDVQKSGGDAVRFYAEDVVYEDMNYEVPFVGKKAVDGFLARFQNIQGVTFNLEEVSDGEEAVGFTYTIQIAGQPRGIRGITFYKVKDGKVCYVRDVPESATKPPPVQQLARLLRPGLRKLQTSAESPPHC